MSKTPRLKTIIASYGQTMAYNSFMKYQWMVATNIYLKKHLGIAIPMALILLWLTRLFYVSFALQIIILLWFKPWHAVVLTILSALGFLLLTIIRDRINAPRPYELLKITPVMPKDTNGHSFPSRHTFSAVLILGNWILIHGLTTSSWMVPVIGLHVVLTLYIMISRVLLTLHFPKDILAGLLSGIFWVMVETQILSWF